MGARHRPRQLRSLQAPGVHRHQQEGNYTRGDIPGCKYVQLQVLPSSTMRRSETVQALALQISESWTAHTLNASRRQHIIGFGAAGYALMHNPLAETLSTKIDRHLRSLAVLQSMSRMAGFGR